MTKFSVTKNGVALNKNLYNWDENTKTFSTNEDGLVLDFTNVNVVTFKTGSNCTFKTGSYCTFKTGYKCTFDTGDYCTFNTSDSCIFKTGYYCTFNTSYKCTFKTSFSCTFNTGSKCTFNTSYKCTFNTSYECTFNTGSECVIVRRDIFEVIEIPENVKIKLNRYEVKGYEEVKDTKTIVIDGNEIEISNESYEELKKSLI